MEFRDRYDAGRKLARYLAHLANEPNLVVLALPRGGVPVAYEVAQALGAPLDVFLVRKLGLPGHEELAMGAIASGGVRVLNEDVVRHLHVPPSIIEQVTRQEAAELERRRQQYRGKHPFPSLDNATVILVDDGLATGASMRAAVTALRQLPLRRLIVAVPVGAAQTCDQLRSLADEVICVITPEDFGAVGLWYRNFEQTTDEEVQALLERAHGRAHATHHP